jgi:hypothetical protein
MERKITILTAVLVLLQLSMSLWALPTTAYEAEMVVRGWLKADPQPLETSLGREVMRIETFTDEYDEPLYYIVYLEPSGFVIVSADDKIEPIIGFAADGTYDPSPGDPLGALVDRDLNGRMSAVRSTIGLFSTFADVAVSDTQKKWSYFISLAEASEGEINLMGRLSISDVRVAPMVQSVWGQQQNCDKNCYNYYTPNNYPSGCGATAMAQLMRFYKYPNEPDDSIPNSLSIFGRRSFTIKVDGKDETRYLKGGDGSGGPYKWDQMVLVPNCSTTSQQRRAIGALCYDAGIATKAKYTSDGTSIYLSEIKNALLETFKYSNAVYGRNEGNNIGRSDLQRMVNPNLDAGHPVIFLIFDLQHGELLSGHFVLCDGYGYNASTRYHHLNMGWNWLPSECRQIWYELPDISYDCSWEDGGYIYTMDISYNTLTGCLYNIFTSGTGEIISGRVTGAFGNPINGAKVTASRDARLGPEGILGGETYIDYTNSKGIYAITGLKSGKTYTLSATKFGYSFTNQYVTTGTSRDYSNASGNKWGINFVPAGSTVRINCATEGFETNDFSKFPWKPRGLIPWVITSSRKHSGTYSAQAGRIENNGSTIMRAVIDDCISGNITFYRKVSSESNFDYLIFYIDGHEKGKWSGEENWAKVSFPVTAGKRIFEWVYTKDSSTSEGYDTAWIDDIVFPVACNSLSLP